MKEFMDCDFNIEKIFVACCVLPGCGTNMHTNRASHGLAFYPDMECTFNFEGKRLTAKKNSIIYLPKGSSYIVEKSSGHENVGCYAINFDISKNTGFSPFVFEIKNTSKVLSLFQQSESVWRTRKTGFHMECKANLYNIICTMKKEYELGYITKLSKDMLSAGVEYIKENYTDAHIDIAYLASLCNISETYFRRQFGKQYGISPVKYINNLKISHAKELLLSQMYTVSEVAGLSGFCDESYFSRKFKEATGLCPSEYFYKSAT